MKAAIVVALLLALASPAAAQEIIVNIDRVDFVWELPPDSPPATEFRFYCPPPTTVPAAVPPTYVIQDPAARRVPVREVVGSPGRYVCVIRPANEFGEAGDSPILSFRTGQAPHPLSGVKFEAK